MSTERKDVGELAIVGSPALQCLTGDHCPDCFNAGYDARDSRKQAQPSGLTVNDLALIRRTILEVLDNGCDCGEWKHGWEFDDADENVANQQRLRFCDAIQRRLMESLK